jgi:hypothetical protein
LGLGVAVASLLESKIINKFCALFSIFFIFVKPTRERRSAHDPGVVLRNLAITIADGEILARADLRGRTHAFTSDCRDAGIRFSVGYEVDEWVRGAIADLPESAW